MTKIKQDRRNYRVHNDENKRVIRKSLEELGAGRSIVIDNEGEIIAGNGVYEQAQKLGIKTKIVETDGSELVVVKRTDLATGDDKRKKLALADNAASDTSEWADELLREDWTPEVLADFGVELPGFETMSAEEAKDVQEDDFDEEKDKVETVCKKGDIWQLGNHRLMCGSCTDADAMERLMDGERADIAFTSPPYNMMATGFDRVLKSGQVNVTYDLREGTYNEFSDDLSNEDYGNLLKDALGMALTHADDALYNIGILASSKIGIVDMMAAYKDKFCDILVWNKNNCIPLGLPSNAGMVSHICELIFCFNKTGSRAFSHPQWKKGVWNGAQMVNRIDSKNQMNNEYSKIHHATFPVEFAGQVVEMYSEKSVLDQFGGTGTTLIACEQLNRKCYMMELDPHYCDVIIARWEKLTGNKATRL